ncbi:L-psp endoribonuclease family protein [Penicillium taxi]|uniref:L-psp endoribonuclease family protein n=1 Tax=Penicillium taxi TaxID=168475 RepID=UPI002544D75B|nr:L-psp endoribonuclease family protein [Penicillium taxi]KAJ5902577.1 L-psp endoribonuclease family protein [Penicillium taxi]
MDATTMKLVDGDIKAHTMILFFCHSASPCFVYLAVCRAAGDMHEPSINPSFFYKCVAVKTLPLNTDLEIECITVL